MNTQDARSASQDLFGKDIFDKKWTGKSQRMVLAIDMGTTQTVVTVAYLEPGALPKSIAISRWPGQERHPQDQTVPTVAVYDGYGQLVACGAEAMRRTKETRAFQEGWTYAKDFKLHLVELFPNGHTTFDPEISLPALPTNVDLSTVYVDFMRYILDHVRKSLDRAYGRGFWASAGGKEEIIFAHPSNWDAARQQMFLRDAAVKAGLISRERVNDHMKFVKEAEASARFFLITANDSPLRTQFRQSTRIVVCDAGGSTADIAAFEVIEVTQSSLLLTELDIPTCLAAGGSRVDYAFESILRDRLLSVQNLDQTLIPRIVLEGVKDFKDDVKRRFEDPSASYTIDLRARNLNDVSAMVEAGELTISGRDIESCFGPSVSRIVAALREQVRSRPQIQYVLSTGGLGESPYLRDRVIAALPNCQGLVTNSPNSKAAAVGALVYRVRELISTEPRRYFSKHRWRSRFNLPVISPTTADSSLLRTSMERVFTDPRTGAPWGGVKPRLVVSIDIGATHSAVALAHLVPGQVPSIFRMSHWASQTSALSDGKVSSLVLYRSRNLHKPEIATVGGEVPRDQQETLDEGLEGAYYFKLHLHALDSGVGDVIPLSVSGPPPLPHGISLQDVYNDYISYIMRHTSKQLIAIAGKYLWAENHGEAEVVLTHPNLWNESQRSMLRDAAVRAHLIARGRTNSSLCFIEEADASVRYFLSRYSTMFGEIQAGKRILVCDAGGSSANIATYDVESSVDKKTILRKAANVCVKAGGIHVDLAFEEYIRDLLESLPDQQMVNKVVLDAVGDFESQAKRSFRSEADTCQVRVGPRTWDFPALNIIYGALTIDGEIAEKTFFAPSVDRIIDAVQTQINEVNGVDYVILIGGFGESRYVRRCFQERFASPGRKIIAWDDASSSKPAALGALMLAVGGGTIEIEREQWRADW